MHTELATTIQDRAVELKVRDLLLNALTVSSGAVDAISFLALGKVFTAFMTGNIAFLGFRAAGAGGPGAVAVLVSMATFAAGVYLSTRIVKPSEPSGRWSQHVTVALGISAIAHAVFVAIWFASHGQPPVDVAHVLLGLWGFAMGMQSAAIRTLHVEGVFTTAVITVAAVATAALVLREREAGYGPKRSTLGESKAERSRPISLRCRTEPQELS